MNVIVAGGGIGGLCLAQGLRKAGVPVTVYERDASPDARSQGYRLNVEPVGSAALKDCLPPELWRELVATAGDPGLGMGVFDEQLRLLMREDGVASTDPAASSHAVSRATLRRILLTGLDDVVRLGKEFQRYEQNPDGTVTAFFADGTSATGDLLVGADGVRSRVRAQLLPDAEVVTTRGCGVGGKVPLEGRWLPEALLTSKNLILPDKDFLFTAVFRRRDQTLDDERDYLMWAFVADNAAIPPQADPRTAVSERAAGWHPSLRRMITEADAVERFAFTRAVKPRPWHGTNVTLLGDAAHCMPPVGGQGGNTAMRDAQVLCGLLATGQPDAIAAYEAQMLDYGFAAVRESSRFLQLAISPSRALRTTARAFFRLCGKVDPLRRAVFSD